MTSAGRLLARLGKFNLVGLLGAALQLFLLYVLTKCFHMPVLAATPVAVEIVVLHNFAWHERFTWRDRQLKSFRQRQARLWRFHAGNGLTSLLGNTVLVYFLVGRLNAPVLPSVIGAILFCSLINFFVADRWVYTTHFAILSRHQPATRKVATHPN
jgi:putative flippase GtrA